MNDTAQINNPQNKAVLFADISGSTRLYEVLGDTRAFETINTCLDILRRLTTAHSGRVIKTIGDEIMSVFPDAISATQAACEMQMVVNAKPPVETIHIAIRIGFHFGPVIESDGDVFGDTVNLAARMTDIAKAEQIITTGDTVSMLPPIVRSGTRAFNSLSVKGKADEVDVREVIWQEGEEMTMMVGNTYHPGNGDPTLLLTYRGNEFIMDEQRPPITIGRGETADIVIQDRRASRLHARIEHRRDKYVFVDLSSNGSYIVVEGETEIQLRREEFVLREKGTLSMGHPYKKDTAEAISFCIRTD